MTTTPADAPRCWADHCHRPATTERIHGMTADGTEVVVLVCPRHALQPERGDTQ